MVEVTVTAQDRQRLGAKLDTFAETLDENERAMLVATLQLADEAWSARRGRAGSPEDEVSGFAFGGTSGGFLVSTPGALPDPSAYLGGANVADPRDSGSGQATGRRAYQPVQISISLAGPTSAFT